MLKKLKLSVVVDLKDKLELMLKDLNANNPEIEQNLSVINTKSDYEEQLIELKLMIQKANLNKHGLFGLRNSYWIYKRSELEREMKRLNIIDGKTSKDIKKIQNIITTIKKKIETINIRLKNFNNKKSVWIKLNPNLGLI
jgi:hypothetical protein